MRRVNALHLLGCRRGLAVTPIHMPALSPTMDKGNIGVWRKEVGSSISPGDILCEIETDKATVDFESQEEGVLAKIVLPSGSSEIPVGDIIAYMADELSELEQVDTDSRSESAPDGNAEVKTKAETPAHSQVSGRQFITPAALFYVQTYGLDPGSISASGPGGRLLKKDVLPHVSKSSLSSAKSSVESVPDRPHKKAPSEELNSGSKSPAPRPSKTRSHQDIPHSNMRKAIASRLLASKQSTPHLYVSADCPLDSLLQARSALKEQGIKVSVTDLLVKACGLVLRDHPALNQYWDQHAQERKQFDSIGISIAVAIEGGLITPIIWNSHSKSLGDISSEISDLVSRAKSGTLQPREYEGGSFSISNLGMFGIDQFSAVINPPQAAILAIGRGRQSVAVLDGLPVLETRMNATLSLDSRVLSEEQGELFLSAFANYLREPSSLIA